jgi:hypothetical protein
MKRNFFLVFVLILFAGASLHAQNGILAKVLELNMPKTADNGANGTRGASVCWNPVNKKYYAAFAGNMSYPLGIFSAAGKLLSDSDQTTLVDMRGLWYNPGTNKISGNTYNDIGWFSYVLNSNGIPTDFTIDFKGMNQPGEQSVGAYDPLLKSICFLDKGRFSFYDIATATPGNFQAIHWGRKKMQGPGENEDENMENEDYNTTTVVYTGIKNAELGVLNTKLRRIELYDHNTGYLQQSLVLPDEAPLQPLFNFAFANGIYWLFDIENRKWIGYKISNK